MRKKEKTCNMKQILNHNGGGKKNILNKFHNFFVGILLVEDVPLESNENSEILIQIFHYESTNEECVLVIKINEGKKKRKGGKKSI